MRRPGRPAQTRSAPRCSGPSSPPAARPPDTSDIYRQRERQPGCSEIPRIMYGGTAMYLHGCRFLRASTPRSLSFPVCSTFGACTFLDLMALPEAVVQRTMYLLTAASGGDTSKRMHTCSWPASARAVICTHQTYTERRGVSGGWMRRCGQVDSATGALHPSLPIPRLPMPGCL